ncbi:unnamed protein product [Pneumocystis jirovecii]|uniref:Uncharacterized protein n=2 Tax=Pneumocystis jirovecii TaxID=42068 RepID=L0PEN1_PNEJI|nr:uncharacterized protein T551_01941 [Pneumocystis jirovecii RU7]KTW29997.1 hypothetical protein T551_01941 [Pneumocystis jirovecii RU7]CCJ30823.1 unnamed protein product [Pneumocystis jirovecii]
MKKKKHQKAQEGDIEPFNHARRLGSTLPLTRFHQHIEKPSSEMIPSFTLGDMILSLKEGSDESARATLHEAFGDCYSYEKFQENNSDKMDEVDSDVCMSSEGEYRYESSSYGKNWEFSVSRSLKQQKHPKLQSHNNKASFSHKENTNLSHPVISNGVLLPNHHPHVVNACVSEEIVCKDFSFSKKTSKKHLSSLVAKFHSSLKEKDFLSVSERKEKKNKVYIPKICEDKVIDNELLSDSDLYDNDDGIFHFDKEYSSSLQSIKGLNEKNRRNTIDKIKSDVEDEKTCTIIIEEKNPRISTCSKIEVSPYSDNEEDLFLTEDFQDENPYIPLFKTQSYERYSSSDDIWNCYSSSFASFVSDANDITDIDRVPNKYFFHNDPSISDQKGDTTDEDQNFIMKKITQKKQNECNAPNDATEKEISCFVEVTNCTLPSHDPKTSILTKENNLEPNHVFTTASSTISKSTTPNIINKPPLLGTWTRDLRRPMGIIDGTCTNIIDPTTSPCTILSPESTNFSPSSIPSLNDILDTSAFVQLSSSNSSSSSITKSYLSDFYRWDRIPIGTFRRHQQRFTNTREELIKGEWYVLTSKSRRQQSNVPILGTTICRKKKRLRKQKYKNKLKNNIELFEEEEEIGKEQCGLGLGPQLSPLFNGLS